MVNKFLKVSHIDKPTIYLDFNELNKNVVCECGSKAEKYMDFSPSSHAFRCKNCGNQYFGPTL